MNETSNEKKIELKIYETHNQYLEAYNFPSWQDKEEINILGKKHVMLTAEYQAKNFQNGLGRFCYFETVAAPQDFNKGEFYYEMKTDYVLILTPKKYENPRHELIKVDGHDNAYLGVGVSFGELDRLVYDIDIIIQNLKDQGMTEEEANEYFSYNILDAYVGDMMPVYMSKIPLEDLSDYNDSMSP